MSSNDKNLNVDTQQNACSASRLSLLSGHLMPAPVPAHSNRSGALPSDYSDITSQLDQLRTIASTPDPNLRGYIRQKEVGKLWVRERIEKLVDAGSFCEVGSVAGTTEWRRLGESREEVVKFTPSNNVQGKL